MIVWAHHMFLTGMGTRLGAFFQITTMIISVPSVVLVTSLMLSLWGGSIRFTTPMLFALAFLPMFGIGGLTGLPLGLAASDVALHDTWYVVGHFHYLVAPGTIFAIFAGIYHWFPKVTGESLNRGLGVRALLGIVRRDERRCSCRCSRWACAASTGASTTPGCSTHGAAGPVVNVHMTWPRWRSASFSCPF